MKILRITVNGLPLFKQELDLLFYTQQRVSEDDKEKLYKIEPNYYLHTACAFIGINASGKTSRRVFAANFYMKDCYGAY